jgi:hypothetical protein
MAWSTPGRDPTVQQRMCVLLDNVITISPWARVPLLEHRRARPAVEDNDLGGDGCRVGSETASHGAG